jgi:anti-sigma regulatory factor (Ser/Thr protein kinase)
MEIRLEARPERLSSVRRALDQMGLPKEVLEDAKLLACELVTNSIRHAGLHPRDLIRVTAAWSGAVLRVIVQDRGSADWSPIAGSIRPAPGAQSGWGLYLVDQLASRWGTNLGGRPGYWFELEALPAASP